MSDKKKKQEEAYIPPSEFYHPWRGPIDYVDVENSKEHTCCMCLKTKAVTYKLSAIGTETYKTGIYNRCSECSGNILELRIKYGIIW